MEPTADEEMPNEYKNNIAAALTKLKAQGSGAIEWIYCTRDFWGDDWDQGDVDAAYVEAENKCLEAGAIIAGMLGEKSAKVFRNADPNMQWMPVEEAQSWNLDDKQLLLYWIHEDKEMPCTVCLYLYSVGDNSHTFKFSDDVDRMARHIYYELDDQEKVALLESPKSTPLIRDLIYQFCRAIPRRHVLDALRRNLHLEFENQTRAHMIKELERAEEELDRFGDAHPVGPAEYERLQSQDEEGIIRFIDADGTSIGARTMAVWKIYLYPTRKMIEALKRNRHRVYDKRHFDNIDQLLADARDYWIRSGKRWGDDDK